MLTLYYKLIKNYSIQFKWLNGRSVIKNSIDDEQDESLIIEIGQVPVMVLKLGNNLKMITKIYGYAFFVVFLFGLERFYFYYLFIFNFCQCEIWVT